MLLKITEEKPRILLFAGCNMVADEIIEYLVCREENIVEIFREEDRFDSDLIDSYQPDIGITCYWPRLIPNEIISLFKYGIINFHPSLLPRNRGWYPSVWQIIEGVKAGVTLHLIDEKADTGPIVAQREWNIEETVLGFSLYNESQLQMIDLFQQTWPRLLNDGIELKCQDHQLATHHTKKEANDLDEIHLNRDYNAQYLINLLRAKTFKDKGYAYYRKNGKKYSIQIKITEEDK